MSFDRAKAAVAETRFADLRWVPETGSTNADVLRELTDPPSRSAPLVLLTDHQTAGRGRLQRDWQAEPGTSVLMTVAVPVPDLPVPRRTLLGLALALAVAGVVPELRLKWPNDLVVPAPPDDALGYRKVGGILAESHRLAGGDEWVLLGIGINANWPRIPEELADLATSLDRVMGHEVDREELVAAVLRELDHHWLPMVEDAARVGELLEAYRHHSATLGGRVRVATGDGEVVGVATGVDAEGALLVTGDDGAGHRVTVGDVVHLRAAP